jgi:replicative DNA helicase
MNIREVEKAILSLLLNDEKCLLRGMEKLTEESFLTKDSSKIFFIFNQLFMAGSSISYLTAASKTHQGYAGYLKEISEIEADPKDLDDLINILDDAKTKRNCVSFASKILQDATDGKSGGEVLDYISDASLKLLSGPEGDIVHIGKIFKERYSEENMNKPKDRRFPSGIPGLDKIITGFRKGNLITIAGKPSSGKSELSRQICYYNALRGVPCLTFTLEETSEECLDKITALATGINHWKILNDYLDVGDKKVIKDAGIDDLPLHFMEDSAPKLAALYAKARKMKHLFGKDFIIIVDHLQILSKDTSVEEISKATKGLKLMAMKLKLPIIALSQLNRESDRREGNIPLLSDLRGSGSIEQDSNIIIFLKVDETSRPDPNKKKTTLWVIKNRGGSTGLVKTINHTPIQKFVEIKSEAPIDAEDGFVLE